MTSRSRGLRALAAAAITLTAAGAAFLLLVQTKLFFLAFLTDPPWAGPLIFHVLLPLAAALLWRRPWWARWIFVGVLLHNLALLGFMAWLARALEVPLF